MTTMRAFDLGAVVLAVCVALPAWYPSSAGPPESVKRRSPQWPAVRAEFLKNHPECAACGSRGRKDKPPQVHHVIPVSVDATGDEDVDGICNELDPDNLITLCVDGVGHCNCHLLIGHGGNLRCRNPFVRRDAQRFREMLNGKMCNSNSLER